MNRKKIQEISLVHTEETTSGDRRKELFDIISREFNELFERGATDFRERVLKIIANNPERFARRFSLDFINSHEGFMRYSVVVSFRAQKDNNLGLRYKLIGFCVELEERNASDAGIISTSVDGLTGYTINSDTDFFNFEAGVISGVNERKPSLVLLYLHQGYQRALQKIKDEVISAMSGALKKKDAIRLFSTVQNLARRLNIINPKFEEQVEELMDARRQIYDFKTAITNAIKELEGTKIVLKSDTLQSIRENLEVALKKNEPQEPHGGIITRS